MAAIPQAQLSEEQRSELLCTYAALILHDDGQEVNAQKIGWLIKGADCSVEAFWPMLFAKCVKNVGMDGLVKMMGGGGGGGAVAAAAPAAGGAAAAAAGGKGAEKKKAVVEEEEEEAAPDFDLFG